MIRNTGKNLIYALIIILISLFLYGCFGPNVQQEVIKTDASYSPDGSKIIFYSNEGGQFNIYVMNTDGSNTIQLTSDAGNNAAPNWSPDGKYIVFSSDRDGSWQIYRMKSDGNQPELLSSATQ